MPQIEKRAVAHAEYVDAADGVCIIVSVMRNPVTAWTKGHELIASKATKVQGLTATPVFNKPQDLMGIATAIDLPARWKEATTWFRDRKKTIVNLDTINEFQKFTDRASDEILDLPPMTEQIINFDASLDPVYVEDYNSALGNASQLRLSLERRGRATQQELHQLMSYLQILQQFLVSPLLAQKGAKAVQKDEQLIQQASAQNSGALQALKKVILDLREEGFLRIMVACCHTSLLSVAECYLKGANPGMGDVIKYHGGLSLTKRGEATHTFLNNPKTIMLMSIDAGGTGLHLVPGANAVVFWGSRPFSPMQVIQTKKRVHRIGQEFAVKVVHLIAKGSVDYAINCVHRDKLTLARAVTDNDMTDLLAEGGKWRTTGRIVDKCSFLSTDGQFANTEIAETEAFERLNENGKIVPTTTSAATPIASGLLVRAATASCHVLPPLL